MDSSQVRNVASEVDSVVDPTTSSAEAALVNVTACEAERAAGGVLGGNAPLQAEAKTRDNKGALHALPAIRFQSPKHIMTTAPPAGTISLTVPPLARQSLATSLFPS
jgi:hypothetical protein